MIKKGIFVLSVLCFIAFLVACESNVEPPINVDSEIEQRIENVFEEIKLPESTLTDLTFNTRSSIETDARISWISQNQVVISNRGQVRRKEVDHQVAVLAIVTLEGVTKSKEFNVLVKSVDSMTLPLEAYKSDYGFAAMTLSNRMNATNTLREVNNEVELLDALKDKSIKIIKINNDLNMGYLNVVRELEKAGKTTSEIEAYTNGSYYRQNQNVPTLHPILLEEGVGQLVIQGRDSLMIYSETGITIKHLTTQIKESKDIVFRNLKLTGIWEWDDDLAANYDALDWDYFTVETTEGLWLDHLSFDQAYDGLVDIKGGVSNVTLSYLWLDFQINDFIMAQFDWLEENYIESTGSKPSSATSRYVRLRQEFNVSKEDIAGYSAMQKKGFNLGNTTMGAGFESITVTIHHSYIRNLADRIPRLRKGDVHMYNVVLDHTDIVKYRNILSGTGTTLVSQGMVPTENGSVLTENSYFIEVIEPIKTHQDSILTSEYTGRYKVVDSILVNGINYYRGDSYENEPGQDPLTVWKQTNTNMPRIEFFMRNYQEIPYKYNTGTYNYVIPTDQLVKALTDETNHVGPGVIEGLNWLEIRKLYSDPISSTAIKGYRIDESSIEINDALIEMNTTFTPLNPIVKNFYKGGPNFVRDKDYSLTVDTSKLDLTKEGEYEVKYTFTNLHEGREWNVVELIQYVYVYDANKANEIYAHVLTDEFNSKVNLTYSVYTGEGTLFYAFSNDPNLSLEEVAQLSDLNQVEISKTKDQLFDLETNRQKYLYMYTLRDGLLSELVKVNVKSEIITYISTAQELNRMITSPDSKGRYYILTNDIDLEGGAALNQLSTINIFSGVFDGNGYKLYNVDKNVLRGGLFMTINGGMIKNLTLDNFRYHVTSLYNESEDQPGVLIETKASADAGILATYVYGSARFENIKIMNSNLITTQNYAGALVGRVRTGVAYFDRISVINTNIEATVASAEYHGGLIGGGETNTSIYMNDIYVNKLSISHKGSNMIGGMIGRVRAHVEINHAVLIDLNINGRHNLGIILGKEDNTTTILNIKNVFANANFTLQPDASNNLSEYFGYIAGNSDAKKITTENVYVTRVEGFAGNSKGNNDVKEILNTLEEVNPNFFEIKLPSIYQSAYWEVKDGMLILK